MKNRQWYLCKLILSIFGFSLATSHVNKPLVRRLVKPLNSTSARFPKLKCYMECKLRDGRTLGPANKLTGPSQLSGLCSRLPNLS